MWLRLLAVIGFAACGLNVQASYAIDDSVLTEVNALGLINDKQFEQLKARREVVVIGIKDGETDTKEIRVTPNTVVVFENQEATEKHFIYLTPDPNNDLAANVLTEMIEPGGRWAASFTSGEYPFYCARHPDNEEEKGRIFSGM